MLKALEEAVTLVRSHQGVDIDLAHLPQDDPKVRKPDISQARALLDWSPKVGMEDGLRITADYFRKELGK